MLVDNEVVSMEEVQHSGTAYQLRSGLVIYSAQDKMITRALTELVEKTPARFALLTDNSGLLIDFHGERGALDLITLGSLAAGDLAASQAIGQLVGEYADYQLVVREGRSHNMFLGEAGRELVLLVQVATDVPLGWARMMVLDTVTQLDHIVASPPLEALLSPPEPLKPLTEADESPSAFGTAGLGDLFNQALDDMWNQD